MTINRNGFICFIQKGYSQPNVSEMFFNLVSKNFDIKEFKSIATFSSRCPEKLNKGLYLKLMLTERQIHSAVIPR